MAIASNPAGTRPRDTPADPMVPSVGNPPPPKVPGWVESGGAPFSSKLNSGIVVSAIGREIKCLV